MSYRDDLDALAARHTALEHELADKTREVAEAANLLEEARAKRRLPLLDNLRIASPCPASWDRMLGDDRVRHCVECNKNVFNLSDMTREEAEALLVEKNGNLCVRYYQRADGTILTSDCAVGVSKRRKRRLIAAGAAALLAGGGGLAARLSSRGSGHTERLGGQALLGQAPATHGLVGAPPLSSRVPPQVQRAHPSDVVPVTGAIAPMPLPDPHNGHTAPKHVKP